MGSVVHLFRLIRRTGAARPPSFLDGAPPPSLPGSDRKGELRLTGPSHPGGGDIGRHGQSAASDLTRSSLTPTSVGMVLDTHPSARLGALVRRWVPGPIGRKRAVREAAAMSQMHLKQPADDLLSAARALGNAAEAPGASAALGAVVPRLQETLRVVSASLYTLADDAVPAFAERRRLGPGVQVDHAAGMSREQEVRVVSTIHDLAATFSRCAGSCDAVREIAVPMIAAPKAERDERPTASPPGPTADRYPRVHRLRARG